MQKLDEEFESSMIGVSYNKRDIHSNIQECKKLRFM